MLQDFPELEAVWRMEVQLSVQPADGVDLRRRQAHAVLDEVLAGALKDRLRP